MIKNLQAKFNERAQSDAGAANTVEMIIIISLAVFAALALFTYVLTPVQKSADGLGKGIESGMDALRGSGGDPTGVAEKFK